MKLRALTLQIYKTLEQQNTIPNFEALARELLADAVVFAEVTSLNFFKESFDKQGWTDGSFQAWQQRAGGNDGRNILIKTGNLRDSLRVLQSSPLRIVFGTSEPYAATHNDGGTINIKVTKRSRKFFWYMFRATGESKWKAMALTKKETLTIKFPKRQFIGESQTLMQTLDQWLVKEIETRFKS